MIAKASEADGEIMIIWRLLSGW